MNVFQSDLIDVINSIEPSSCPYHINLHCHSIHSDGSMEPIDILHQAQKIGLSHIAVTDHHSIQAYQEINNVLLSNPNVEYKYPSLWSGIEISALLNNCLVHILGLGFDISSPSLSPYINGESAIGSSLSAYSVITAIHDAGGLAVLAHPARYRVAYDILIDSANKLGIDGLETWYDYDYGLRWEPSSFICEKIKLKSLQHNLLSTCGTDSHGYQLTSR